MPRKALDPQRPVILPWRVVIDTAEQSPWTFTDIKASPAEGRRPIIVETVTRCLGRHPASYGDYTLESADGEHSAMGLCAIERKSMADFQDTLLNWSEGRPDRFRQELETYRQVILAGGVAAVILECNYDDAIKYAPEFGTKKAAENARGILGSILMIAQDYAVPVLPMGDRRLAELTAFKYLERFWKHRKHLVVPEKVKA